MKWKTVKVMPQYKGSGEKHQPKKFRPVSLLSLVSRLVEQVITIQVIEHLERKGMFGKKIHRYGAHYCCETSVHKLLEHAAESQEESTHFSLFLFDQSVAFDLLD